MNHRSVVVLKAGKAGLEFYGSRIGDQAKRRTKDGASDRNTRNSPGGGMKKSYSCQLLNRICTGRAQVFNSAAQREPQRPGLQCGESSMAIPRGFLLAVLLVLGGPAAIRADTDATLFRLFLTDGTTLVSYGEFARLSDSVVFSMPVGGTPAEPRLHIVTLPAERIDWARTDRYAASARYQRYAETRGEEDFARLTNDVARILNEVALTTDRQQALAVAEQARSALAEWPQSHFGYRQRDVNEIVMLLDEAISDLRAAAGANRFDVALVASPGDVVLEPLVGMPSPRELLTQVVRAAELAARPTDRVALLQAVLALIGEAEGGAIPAADADVFRRWAEDGIRAEQFIDSRYAEMTRRLLGSATQAAERARVADVERVLQQIPREDDRLGRRRPETVAALRATVQGQLEGARELRLLRDRWTLRRGLYQEYQRSVGSELLQLAKSEPALEAVRRLEGPDPSVLLSLRAALSGGAERLMRQLVPADLRPTHDLMVSAWRFAENALDSRYQAVQSGNVTTAWEASSAAAGALLMLSRARQELASFLELPQLR
jgi:hypothetical protein